MKNTINHPQHYNQYPVEVIEITKYLGFCLGNIVKYVLRSRYKNGKEDIKKALVYLEWEKECSLHFQYTTDKQAIIREKVGIIQKALPKNDKYFNLIYSFLDSLLLYFNSNTMAEKVFMEVEKCLNDLLEYYNHSSK